MEVIITCFHFSIDQTISLSQLSIWLHWEVDLRIHFLNGLYRILECLDYKVLLVASRISALTMEDIRLSDNLPHQFPWVH